MRPRHALQMKSALNFLTSVAFGVSLVGAACAQSQAPLPPNRTLTVDPISIDESSAPGWRVFHLPSAISLVGAAGCSSASTIKVRIGSSADRIGERGMVANALSGQISLILVDAQCVAPGVMSGSRLELAPKPIAAAT